MPQSDKRLWRTCKGSLPKVYALRSVPSDWQVWAPKPDVSEEDSVEVTSSDGPLNICAHTPLQTHGWAQADQEVLDEALGLCPHTDSTDGAQFCPEGSRGFAYFLNPELGPREVDVLACELLFQLPYPFYVWIYQESPVGALNLRSTGGIELCSL